MVEPEAGVVAHRLSLGVMVFRGLAALGNPDEVEVLRQFVGLAFQDCPLRVGIAVPVESLQHHALIVFWPALGGGSEE